MGRLENIIARNRKGRRPNERVVVSMVVGLIVLLILGLAVFTDLGVPPADPPVQAPAPAAAPRDHRGKRVDGVLLRKVPPAPTPTAPTPR